MGWVRSSWLRSKRSKSYLKLTYGHSLKNSLNKADVDTEIWHVLILDWDGLRDVTNNISLVYE